ncbi:MAG TPA: lysozyme inhibitor LprI family protein [Xanthobacteraceae bacterium]|jgi:uncharacterized protein YecT (DUF1311 family)|nr:lysozyme inhibitor LprI family protein [Xanthobacteraceae bacterium]
MTLRLSILVAMAAAFLVDTSHAAAAGQDDTAIRACAQKYVDDIDEGERHCIFAIVADPCTEKPENQSTVATAECYDRERKIWDALLNENFRALGADLDEAQKVKLRDMQRAWIAYRDTTCSFYHDKIRGTMATSMAAACVARETARRALLLKVFQGL